MSVPNDAAESLSRAQPKNAGGTLTDSWRHFIGWSQIVGAALGILGVRTTLFLLPEGAIARLAMVLAWSYFTLGAYAGFSLLRNRAAAVPLSLLVQGVQIVSVHRIGGAVLAFLLGPALHVSLWAVGVGLGGQLGGHAGATLLYGSIPATMGFDLTGELTQSIVRPEYGTLVFSINIIAAMATRQLFREWMRSDT